ETVPRSLPVMKEEEEEDKMLDFFPIFDLPAELSSKILSQMGRKELGICLQSLSLDKIHAEWRKGKKIEELTIRKNSEMNTIEMKCSRYGFPVKTINPSLPHLFDRFREVYEKCEIGRMTISVSPNLDKSLYNNLVECCKRIKCVDDLIISFPIIELPAKISSKILSYVGEKELSVCLQSFTLDKMHAEWSEDKRIEFLSIDLNHGNVSYLFSTRYGNFTHTFPARLIIDRFREFLHNFEFKQLYITSSTEQYDPELYELLEQCMQ
ncbi:hypothetical protein PFISCL1PPCAC_21260, partial [Pristionchus fissidentatus]